VFEDDIHSLSSVLVVIATVGLSVSTRKRFSGTEGEVEVEPYQALEAVEMIGTSEGTHE
jgi:hypothetical protein